jgi:glycosyltransferase involved in cell wall biosynthesis
VRGLIVTHVFPRYEDDPSAPFLLTWAQALHSQGVAVWVIAPHDKGLPPSRNVNGVPVRFVRYAPDRLERLAYRGEMHHIARRPGGPLLFAALLGAMARAVRVEVRRARPDLLHVHWWLPGAVIARLARVDVPWVVTVHGTDVALLEGRPHLVALARWALAGADRVEAVSTDLAERLERVTGRVADAVNPMPLRADRLRPLGPAQWARGSSVSEPRGTSSTGLRVLAIGRMVPEKGFADLVSAVALLHRRGVKLTIIGEGPERERLASQARALDVSLELPGRLDPAGLHRAYVEADVVVQSSHREGLGLVAAEALALGLPVVATDSGGARDVLDGLVPVGDAQALASRLTAIAANLEAARLATAPLAERVRIRLSPAAAAARTLEGWRAVGFRPPAFRVDPEGTVQEDRQGSR